MQSTIATMRLENQLISQSIYRNPADVVAHLGAVQAQNHPWALWGIGLRTPGTDEKEVEKALGDRSIVRTWLGRGTIHFAAAGDVRWMLELFRERNIGGTKTRFKQLGIDDGVISDSRKIIANLLRDGNQLSRQSVLEALETAHISTQGQRGIHIVQRMAQEGLICFGPRQGKKYTFVLLDKWVPMVKPLNREESLEKLAVQYMISHGPATLLDFTWWSGLAATEAAAGLESAKQFLIKEIINGQSYWRTNEVKDTRIDNQTVYLLPAFDEYLIGYKDRNAVLDPKYSRSLNDGGGIIKPTILINGFVKGTWKRIVKKKPVIITPEWFEEPDQEKIRSLESVASSYGAFIDMPVIIQ